MSESDEVSTSPKTEAEFIREEWATTRPFDPELMRLVGFLNVVDTAEIGLTLYIGGGVISGMLISLAQFYRLLVKEFTDLNRVTAESNRDAAASFAEFYRLPLEGAEKILEEYRTSDVPPPLPRHIHLRHAQILVAGSEPYTQPLWRGRLTQVDGWAFGNFGPIPPLAQSVVAQSD